MYALRMSGNWSDGQPGYASQCVRLRRLPGQMPAAHPDSRHARPGRRRVGRARFAGAGGAARRIFKVEAK